MRPVCCGTYIGCYFLLQFENHRHRDLPIFEHRSSRDFFFTARGSGVTNTVTTYATRAGNNRDLAQSANIRGNRLVAITSPSNIPTVPYVLRFCVSGPCRSRTHPSTVRPKKHLCYFTSTCYVSEFYC